MEYPLLTREELYANAGGVMMVDSETFGNYSLIAFKCYKTKKYLTFETSPDDRFDEKALSWIMHNYLTVGFNSIAYDIPLIWFMYANQDTRAIKNASNALIFQGLRRREFEREFDMKVYPTRHIDLIEVCPLDGSLKTYIGRLHGKRIQELPFDPSSDLTKEQAETVKEYCLKTDLDGTELVFDNLAEQLKLRDELSVQYKTDLMSKSDPQVAEAIIKAEIEKLSGKRIKHKIRMQAASHKYKVPDCIEFQTPSLRALLKTIREADYDVLENGRVLIPDAVKNARIQVYNSAYRIGNGGLHSCENHIGYRADDKYGISDIDVSSFYPRIILSQLLTPKQLGHFFLTVYRDLFERRIKAKAAKLFAISEGLKIALNGVFGKMGSPYSIVYSPDLLIQVTVTGQLELLMFIERVEARGFKVINANTDGIVIYYERSRKAELDQIKTLWERDTNNITEETKYSAYYARDVNGYMAIKEPDEKGFIEIKGKNVFNHPWNKGQKMAIFRFHKNPNATICIEAIEELIRSGTPIEKTIKESRDFTQFVSLRRVTGGARKNDEFLGRVVRFYYAADSYGPIQYVVNGHMVPETDGAKPCMELPEAFPTDINYGWYINRTYSLLEEMNFHCRKLSLFD